MSDFRRVAKRPLTGLVLLAVSMMGLGCVTPSQPVPGQGEPIRAEVELGKGLRSIRVEAALLDTSGSILRGQVELSNQSPISAELRGYFQWKDVTGINLGGTATEMRTLRSGSSASFTSYAPSPEAYRYVFVATKG